jgi:integrase
VDGWDQREGRIDPKSRAGIRRIPIISRLGDLLMEHRAITDRQVGLVFGRSADTPFSSNAINGRAKRAWRTAQLNPIGLHEARHTAASFFIAAGLNPKTISTYMGHASIAFTHDRYGHLLPGNENESAALLDSFFERADTANRLRQLG